MPSCRCGLPVRRCKAPAHKARDRAEACPVPVLRCSRGGDPGSRARRPGAQTPRIAEAEDHKPVVKITRAKVRCLRFAPSLSYGMSVMTRCRARGALSRHAHTRMRNRRCGRGSGCCLRSRAGLRSLGGKKASRSLAQGQFLRSRAAASLGWRRPVSSACGRPCSYESSLWPRNSLALATSLSHLPSCSGFRKAAMRS